MFMSDEEKRIWDAAYATAFITDFRAFQERVGTVRALEVTSADTAAELADEAVRRLRELRKEEDPDIGWDVDHV